MDVYAGRGSAGASVTARRARIAPLGRALAPIGAGLALTGWKGHSGVVAAAAAEGARA